MPCSDFKIWAQTELGRMQIRRLFESCSNETGGFTILPSQRVCPNQNINFRFAFDEIVRKIGIEEIVKSRKQKKQEQDWQNAAKKFGGAHPTARQNINQATWGGKR